MARKMKDSGIEWIGEIPYTWKLSKIGQAYSERRTKVSDRDYPALSVTMKGILPQLDTAAKTDAHDDRKLLCRGDFAINSRSDRRGACGISQVDGSVSLINIVLQPKSEMDSQYYEWVFQSTMFSNEFYKWGHGIVDDLWTTGWQDMKRIAIPAPTLREQKRIAMFLNEQCSEFDNICQKTRASIEEYKKLKQAIITQAVTKGVRSDRVMIDSGIEWIGDIPSTWNQCKLKNVSVRIGDGLHGTPEFDDNGNVFFINGNNIGEKYLKIRSDTKRLSVDELMKYSAPTLNDNTIMIALNGATYGKVSLYKNYPVLLGKSAGYITLLETVCREYIRYYLMSSASKLMMALSLNGTTIQNLSLATLNNFPTLLPPIEEQWEIAQYLDGKVGVVDALIMKKEQYLLEIENYKKSLIYEYVTGKKEVPQRYQT